MKNRDTDRFIDFPKLRSMGHLSSKDLLSYFTRFQRLLGPCLRKVNVSERTDPAQVEKSLPFSGKFDPKTDQKQ